MKSTVVIVDGMGARLMGTTRELVERAVEILKERTSGDTRSRGAGILWGRGAGQ